jgi:hypothetical protein
MPYHMHLNAYFVLNFIPHKHAQPKSAKGITSKNLDNVLITVSNEHESLSVLGMSIDVY